MTNEAALCRSCHTLVHAGLLVIERTAAGGLRWHPRVRSAGVAGTLKLPSPAELTAGVPLPAPKARLPNIDIDALVIGLTGLGYGRREAQERLDRSIATLERQARMSATAGSRERAVRIDEAMVLREALGRPGA